MTDPRAICFLRRLISDDGLVTAELINRKGANVLYHAVSNNSTWLLNSILCRGDIEPLQFEDAVRRREIDGLTCPDLKTGTGDGDLESMDSPVGSPSSSSSACESIAMLEAAPEIRFYVQFTGTVAESGRQFSFNVPLDPLKCRHLTSDETRKNPTPDCVLQIRDEDCKNIISLDSRVDEAAEYAHKETSDENSIGRIKTGRRLLKLRHSSFDKICLVDYGHDDEIRMLEDEGLERCQAYISQEKYAHLFEKYGAFVNYKITVIRSVLIATFGVRHAQYSVSALPDLYTFAN